VTQGSYNYLQDIAYAMSKAKRGMNVPQKNAAGTEILDALFGISAKSFLYFGVKGAYDPNNPTANVPQPKVIFTVVRKS